MVLAEAVVWNSCGQEGSALRVVLALGADLLVFQEPLMGTLEAGVGAALWWRQELKERL